MPPILRLHIQGDAGQRTEKLRNEGLHARSAFAYLQAFTQTFKRINMQSRADLAQQEEGLYRHSPLRQTWIFAVSDGTPLKSVIVAAVVVSGHVAVRQTSRSAQQEGCHAILRAADAAINAPRRPCCAACFAPTLSHSQALPSLAMRRAPSSPPLTRVT